MHFIGLDDVEPLLLRAWEQSCPFSLIRLGDGENTVLQYPRYCDKARAQFVFRRAFEDRHYERDEILAIRAMMIAAVRDADLVGLHDSQEHNPVRAIYEEHLQYAGLRNLTACNHAVHLALQSFGAIERLIARADRVTLICGRDVVERVRQQFPGVASEQITVPTERQYRLTEDAHRHTEPHYPDAFRKVMASIQVVGPHHLFLIGAGFLGKVYCGHVKRNGGFALDIGSVFDYWGQVPTREGRRCIENDRVVFEGESRWPGIYLGQPTDDPDLIRRRFPGMFREMRVRPMPAELRQRLNLGDAIGNWRELWSKLGDGLIRRRP